MYVLVHYVRYIYSDPGYGSQQPKRQKCSVLDINARLFRKWETNMEKNKEDRRINRTRKALQAALLELMVEKGYDAVTVQDVIDRADVGRSTFYAHFQDKEDLFLQGFEILKEQIEEKLDGIPLANANPWDLSLMMFEHVEGQEHLYKALTGNQAGNIAMNHIQKYLTEIVQSHLNQNLPMKNDNRIPLDILAHFIVSSFLSLLTWWLDTHSNYSPGEMNEIFRRLTQPGVEAVFLSDHT
jgi:AcrR family transcriptional regulator